MRVTVGDLSHGGGRCWFQMADLSDGKVLGQSTSSEDSRQYRKIARKGGGGDEN